MRRKQPDMTPPPPGIAADDRKVAYDVVECSPLFHARDPTQSRTDNPFPEPGKLGCEQQAYVGQEALALVQRTQRLDSPPLTSKPVRQEIPESFVTRMLDRLHLQDAGPSRGGREPTVCRRRRRGRLLGRFGPGFYAAMGFTIAFRTDRWIRYLD